jgi:hypothetical protein
MSYFAYGLRIASDMPLPELPWLRPDGRAADVQLRLTSRVLPRVEPPDWTMRLERPDGKPWLHATRREDGYFLRHVGVADFLVSGDGRTITCCSTTPGVSDTELRHVALDQVMALVLKLRGTEPVHAAAVMTPPGVSAFVGPGGAGKSTMAAAFQRRGFTVISDDCLPIIDCDGRLCAVPAYPGVRLWDGPRKTRHIPAGAIAAFPATPQPLARLYRIDRSDDIQSPCIEPMTMRDAVMELVSATFQFDAGNRGMLLRELQRAETLAREAPMRRLRVAGDVEAAAACAAVLDDLRRAG